MTASTPAHFRHQVGHITRIIPRAGTLTVIVGKHIELTVEAPDEATARVQVRRMAVELFSNPVIESHRVVEGEEIP